MLITVLATILALIPLTSHGGDGLKDRKVTAIRTPVPGAQVLDSSSGLRTLTTAHEAHSLTTAQAALGYPINLQGVVTYFDPYIDPRHIALFIHDSTGSIFVFAPKGSTENMPPETMVTVTGVSGVGDFAPIVADPHVSVIGRGRIPLHAPSVSLGRLMTPSSSF